MRLVTGYDDCGHTYIYDVSTFEQLKAYLLMSFMDHEIPYYEELIKKIEAAITEEELLSYEIIDCLCDLEVPPFQGRDMFTRLIDPLEK